MESNQIENGPAQEPNPQQVHDSWYDRARRVAAPVASFGESVAAALGAGIFATEATKVDPVNVKNIIDSVQQFGMTIPPEIIQHLPNNVNLNEVAAIGLAIASAGYFGIGVLQTIRNEGTR